MSGLAGLATIALAAAHLEEVESSGTAKKVPGPNVSPSATKRPEHAATAGGHVVAVEPTPLSHSARQVSTDRAPLPSDFLQQSVPASAPSMSEDGNSLQDFDPVEHAGRILEKIQGDLRYQLYGSPPEVEASDPFIGISDDDVLCGRGGETNHHPGNVKYRQLVKACQSCYMFAKRCDKPKISALIVQAIRMRGGRFLRRPGAGSPWIDVGNQKAREKTSQALREGQSDMARTAFSEPQIQAAMKRKETAFMSYIRGEEEQQKAKKRRVKKNADEKSDKKSSRFAGAAGVLASTNRESPSAVSFTDDESASGHASKADMVEAPVAQT